MTTPCVGATDSCTGLDLLPVRFGLRRDVSIVCSGCRGTALYMSAATIERRVSAVPVKAERRRFVPAWLERLTARDLTDRRSA